MAEEVRTAIVDPISTTIDIEVVQYNKETGWGKFRNDEWDGLSSFNVPADLNEELKEILVRAMNHDIVEVDCYFVRSPAQVRLRIIVFDVRYIKE